MKKRIVIWIIIVLMVSITSCENDDKEEKSTETMRNTIDEKPIIYLYPKQKERIKVQLEYDGELICTYPRYDHGWEVLVSPDGTIYDEETDRTYSYLFWEGEDNHEWKFDEGFVAPGNKTVEFLQDKLEYLGLKPEEYNEFIVYWLPKMESSKYNLVYFAGEEYTNRARLNIEPKPDSIQRIFMVIKSIDKPVNIKEQQLVPFKRTGFTVIEWGGTKVE